MTIKLLTLFGLVAALAAAGCGNDDDVTTEPGAPVDEAATRLTVVLDGGEFDRFTYTVTCGDGDGPAIEPPVEGLDPAAACDRLADIGAVQRLVQGPAPDRICTEIYGGPQEAAITGTLDGQPVDATVTRVNGCEIDDWDRVLDGFLPPTQGVQAE
jgi:hypothetical protein